MEVAELDYEKVWFKVLGQVIYHSRAKQWYLYKTLLLSYMNDYNYMNKLNFYLRYINTLK